MKNDQSKCFAIFECAKNKKNPSTSTPRKPQLLSSREVLFYSNPELQSCTSRKGNKLSTKDLNTKNPQPSGAISGKIETPVKKKVIVSRTKYTEDDDAKRRMEDAFNAYHSKNLLRNGMSPSVRNCAKFYGVVTSTLSYRTAGKRSVTNPQKPGRPSVFSKTQLQQIVNHLLIMANLGYGYSEIQAMNLMRYLAKLKDSRDPKDEKGSSEFKASHGFMSYLFTKFPELTKRKALALDYQRTEDIINRFFQVVNQTYTMCKDLSGQDINPSNVWSMDEVDFALTDAGEYKIIARRGSRNTNVISSADRTNISVVFCTNAKGFCLESCFILRGSAQTTAFKNHCIAAGFHDPLVIGAEKAYITYDCFDKMDTIFCS